jgi:hypothetical protein
MEMCKEESCCAGQCPVEGCGHGNENAGFIYCCKKIICRLAGLLGSRE